MPALAAAGREPAAAGLAVVAGGGWGRVGADVLLVVGLEVALLVGEARGAVGEGWWEATLGSLAAEVAGSGTEGVAAAGWAAAAAEAAGSGTEGAAAAG